MANPPDARPVPAPPGPAPAAWAVIAARLPPRDAAFEWYELRDFLPLLGIGERQLRNHCRRLWPGHDRGCQWRLDHAQAVRLIRAVCFAGKKAPRVAPGVEPQAPEPASDYSARNAEATTAAPAVSQI